MSGDVLRKLDGAELGEAQKVLLNPVEAQTWNGAEPANEDEFDKEVAAAVLAQYKAGELDGQAGLAGTAAKTERRDDIPDPENISKVLSTIRTPINSM